MIKTKKTKITLPKLKLLDAERGWQQQNKILSSFAQTYFSGKAGVINILEAGCGQKWNLNLGGISYKLTGIDISKKALELRETNKGDLDRAIVGDLHDVDLDREAFDMIYCVDVIEHINGAKQVLTNFFIWLKSKGLLILVFPDRDSVFGFITRILPHWVHILYYKYIMGNSNAGKPGFGPFPTFYDKIVSRWAIKGYCYKHGHKIIVEYGRPFNFKKLGWLASGTRAMFKLLQYLSFGKLTAGHGDLIYVIEKQ